MIVLELTIPFNSSLSFLSAQTRKEEKYQLLLSDLEAKGLKPLMLTIEVGSLGHSPPRAFQGLHKLFPSLTKQAASQMLDECGRVAISASQHIFFSRREPSWNTAIKLLHYS